MASIMSWKGGKRSAIVKGKPRTAVPATPWRPRISRRSSTLATEDPQDEPSPLDRKAVRTTLNLKLGARIEPVVVSPAPTSATLVAGAGAEMGEPIGSQQDGDAYRRDIPEPGAPQLEQGPEWSGDRWRSMRPRLSTGLTDQGLAHMVAFQAGCQAPHLRSGPALRSDEAAAAYDASARRADACLQFDMNHETNVYINGLPREMTDHMLYLLGSTCGVVISHKAMLDRDTDLCKGFGFVMYASPDMAKHAIEWLNSHGFGASFAKESFSAKLRRMADTSSTNVYLSNLPIKFTVQQLEQLFVPYPIASLKILYDLRGESRGVGFVRLFDRAAAKECIERLHGRMLPGTTLPLRVRFADSDAQKHLKHSASQKHTLESLGLLMLDARPNEQSRRIMTRDELDASACAGQPRNMDRFPRPIIPCATSVPVNGRWPPSLSQSVQGNNGLGIQVPSQMMWTHPHANKVAHHGMWPAAATAGVVYPGLEGLYAHGGPYPMSPIISGAWDGHKGPDRESGGYLPIPLNPPPPGLTRVVNVTSLSQRPAANHDDRYDGSRYADSGKSRARHVRNRKIGARVRLPGDTVDSGARAVSDPMAMLAAQKRVREALGLPERVRAAVSADNSIDEDQEHAPANTSFSSDGSSEDNEESFSIEIQTHADPHAA